MHILWITENYYPGRGGMAQSCDRIVQSLRTLPGNPVQIDLVHFTGHSQQQPPRIERQWNGRYIGWPVGQDAPHAMNCLWNWIENDPCRDQFTHVVAFGGLFPMQAAPVFAAWLQLPLITLVRGNDFDAAIFTQRRSDILREALIRSARVCVVTREKSTKIRALFPQIEPVWIPNGIDLTEWEPLPSHIKTAQEWRIANGCNAKKVLGLFGHIKQKKGGLFFLECLLDSGYASQFHLLLVGEADPEVLSWLSQQEISHSVTPFVDRYELLAWYAACDLVVIPSFYDGLPNVLLEAAALGIPLLASRAGGMEDALEDAIHGFLFHPGDADECKRAIERAAKTDDLASLSSACRTLVRTRFTHTLEAERYLAVLEEALHSNRECIGGSI